MKEHSHLKNLGDDKDTHIIYMFLPYASKEAEMENGNGKWVSTRIQLNLLRKFFSLKKRIPQEHPPLYFNGIEVKRIAWFHLGLIFDHKLNCSSHFKEKSAKARKAIGMTKQLREYLPTNVLDQIYKMQGRSHLNYCDFIYQTIFLNWDQGKKDQGTASNPTSSRRHVSIA